MSLSTAFCGCGMLVCEFCLGSHESGIEPDFSSHECQFVIGQLCCRNLFRVCAACDELPVRRNALPLAYENKSFQINHTHSIISYSCLPCMSFTFSPLTKSFFMGKL